jgi:hypothetical protein
VQRRPADLRQVRASGTIRWLPWRQVTEWWLGVRLDFGMTKMGEGAKRVVQDERQSPEAGDGSATEVTAGSRHALCLGTLSTLLIVHPTWSSWPVAHREPCNGDQLTNASRRCAPARPTGTPPAWGTRGRRPGRHPTTAPRIINRAGHASEVDASSRSPSVSVRSSRSSTSTSASTSHPRPAITPLFRGVLASALPAPSSDSQLTGR